MLGVVGSISERFQFRAWPILGQARLQIEARTCPCARSSGWQIAPAVDDSVIPYPSIIRQPNATLMKSLTGEEIGAEPVIM
jgi:hypothetical protein